MTELVLAVLPDELSIHRLPGTANLSQVLSQVFSQVSGELAKTPKAAETPFFASLHSKDELSIVCTATAGKIGDRTSGPWRAIYVDDQLDFTLTGVLAGLTAPLAAAEISIFAISSFDTDYLLVKADKLDAAIDTLANAGYRFRETTKKPIEQTH